MKGLNSLDETYKEYLLAPTDEGGKRSRSQQAVGVVKVSTSTSERRSPLSS